MNVLSDDAALVRAVVKALNDPDERYEVRNLLQRRFAKAGSTGLKAMLAVAPLEGIDLRRDRDVGRPVEF
jgi:hypothetical protein